MAADAVPRRRGSGVPGSGESWVLAPSPALAPFVSSLGYYRATFPPGRELVLPGGDMQLLVNLAADELYSHPAGDPVPQRVAGAAVQGAHGRPAVIDPANQRSIICVGLRLGGAHPFFPVPASELRDRVVPLDALWGRDGATLRERLLAAPNPVAALRELERVLLARAVRPLAPDPAVTAAARALHRGATVAETTDRLGWTHRQLARRFAERVGLTPKRFARVRRFQRLVVAVTRAGGYGREADWAALAADCGYHDQPHMIHDFRAFAGLRPTEYAPRSAGARNHVPLNGEFLQSQAWSGRQNLAYGEDKQAVPAAGRR